MTAALTLGIVIIFVSPLSDREKKRRKQQPKTTTNFRSYDMLLYFSKKAKFLIIIGAILTAIGFIIGSYFGSIVITMYPKER
jgi:lipid-binding SYLF domain-containing protein